MVKEIENWWMTPRACQILGNCFYLSSKVTGLFVSTFFSRISPTLGRLNNTLLTSFSYQHRPYSNGDTRQA